MTNCPKCGFECIETKVALICPNCDYTSIKKDEWKGETTKCPKCTKEAKLFKNHGAGKTFVCEHCEATGRFIDDKELHAKVVQKDSEVGKKLAWLFDVPTKIFHHHESLLDEEDEHCKGQKKRCPHCDVKEICEVHQDEVDKFCKKHNIDVYITNDYIEIVHK